LTIAGPQKSPPPEETISGPQKSPPPEQKECKLYPGDGESCNSICRSSGFHKGGHFYPSHFACCCYL